MSMKPRNVDTLNGRVDVIDISPDADVLEVRSEGREKLFLNKRLLELLVRDVDEFAPFPE